MPSKPGYSCIAKDTKIHLHNGSVKDVEDVESLWRLFYSGDETDDRRMLSNQATNRISSGVWPLFIVSGKPDHCLVKIKVESENEGEVFSLVATEWHPVLKVDNGPNVNHAVPICFLERCDRVVTVDGPGSLIEEPQMVRPITVYGIALGNTAFHDEASSTIKDFVQAKNIEANVPLHLQDADDLILKLKKIKAPNEDNLFGLKPADHFFYANGIACGSFNLQRLLLNKLNDGIDINTLQTR